MIPYCLHCSVCKNSFNKSDSWTKHLFGSYHQNRARAQFFKWQDNRKECALVVFFSCSLTLDDTQVNGKCGKEKNNFLILLRNHLLKIESSQEDKFWGPLLITDFVWWDEQPKMGILQFESREKVNQVYGELTRNGKGVQTIYQIGNHMVQFKKLEDLLDLEWRLLVPDSRNFSLKHSSTSAPTESPPQKKQKTCDNNSFAGADSSTDQPSCYHSNFLQLNSQYNEIIKSVEIPEQLYQQALDVTGKIKEILSCRFPHFEVCLFRDHYLRIRNPMFISRNDVLIFVHRGSDTGSIKPRLDQVSELILKNYGNKFGGTISKSAVFYSTKEYDLDRKSSQRFNVMDTSSSSFQINVFIDLYFLHEAQLCRLLCYLCKFDWRCRPLMLLHHYFCTVNSCHFDDSHSQGETMEWLVIAFMTIEGYIPTARKVLNQPHKPLWLKINKKKVDIGFNDSDEEYLNEWKKSCAKNCKLDGLSEDNGLSLSVLKLFQQFQKFCANTISKGNLLLNIRDGELFDRQLIIKEKNEKERVSLKTKLTQEEINVITSDSCHLKKWDRWPLNIVNPLLVNRKLGYKLKEFRNAVQLMDYGANELKRFLDGVENGGMLVKERDLERILRIDEATKANLFKTRVPWHRTLKRSSFVE